MCVLSSHLSPVVDICIIISVIWAMRIEKNSHAPQPWSAGLWGGVVVCVCVWGGGVVGKTGGGGGGKGERMGTKGEGRVKGSKHRPIFHQLRHCYYFTLFSNLVRIHYIKWKYFFLVFWLTVIEKTEKRAMTRILSKQNFICLFSIFRNDNSPPSTTKLPAR